jgi:hypothetical protein
MYPAAAIKNVEISKPMKAKSLMCNPIPEGINP